MILCLFSQGNIYAGFVSYSIAGVPVPSCPVPAASCRRDYIMTLLLEGIQLILVHLPGKER